MTMVELVLRIRLTGGGQVDVSYDAADAQDEQEAIERAVSELAEDSGVLRARHGDRMVVVFGRGVAALEVSPRGAVL